MKMKSGFDVLSAVTCLAACLFGCTSSLAAAPEIASTEAARQDRPWIIVVRGAHGAPSYREDFATWTRRWQSVARRIDASFELIGEPLDPDADSVAETETSSAPAESLPPESPTDKQQLLQMLRSVPPRSRQPVWLILIGHGTSLRDEHKFNLRGPDITASELAQSLDHLQRPTAIINAASSSGPFLPALSGPDRIVLTATQSGTEKNATRFGDFFSQAVGSPDADLDHDRAVSVLEAFAHASARVREAYEQDGRILTEHALIDDNGDGRGTPAEAFRGIETIAEPEDDLPLDGEFAARITMPLADDPVRWTDDQLARRDRLEDALDKLRRSQKDLDPEAYDEKLEAILVPLARLYQEVESPTASAAEPPAP